MTFGLHVACAYVGSSTPMRDPASALERPIWSERLTAGQTTTLAAPGHSHQGSPVFHMVSLGPAYLVFGPDPDAPGAPELLILDLEPITVFVKPGDRVKYVPA